MGQAGSSSGSPPRRTCRLPPPTLARTSYGIVYTGKPSISSGRARLPSVLSTYTTRHTPSSPPWSADLSTAIPWTPRTSSTGLGVSNDSLWLCELALRIASCPEGVIHWAAHRLDHGIETLIGQPHLVRAARLLVLAINFHYKSEDARPGRLYPDWNWE